MFFNQGESVGGWIASRWQNYLFNSRVKRGSLKDQIDVLGEAITDNTEDAPTRSENFVANIEAVEANTKQAKAFGSEVFGRLYGSPEQAEATVGWAKEAHRLIDDMQEFELLRRSVVSDPDFSALAARDILSAICGQVENLMKSSEEQDKDDEEQDNDDEEQDNDGKGQPSGGEGNDGLPTPGDIARSALRSAVRKIAAEVDETKDMMNGISPGLGGAPAAHKQEDSSRYKLAELVHKADEFKRIMERAGRLRRIATNQKRVRDSNMRSEVVDIERGADLSRVLPSQIAGLRHPVLSKVVKRGIVEKTLIQYRLEGSEVKGRGPIVVLLDRSGSMEGECEVWASAIGIAMVGVASKAKRPLTVLGFNGRITSGIHMTARGDTHIVKFDDDMAGWEQMAGNAELPFKKVSGGAAAVAASIATEVSDGGTLFAPVFRAALHHLPANISDDKADLIFVTDGSACLDDDLRNEIAAAKERGLRIYGMTIDGGSISEVMQVMCDECIDIDPYGTSEGVVGDVLGR